jgi:O-antigen/teichoic acid export membrane protein
MTIETEIDEIAKEEQREALAHRSLESRALKGTYYVVAFYGISSAIRLCSSIVLTWLFAPDLFGVMALLTTVIIGLNLFSHIGLEDSIVQNPRGDDEIFVNTAWTIQALRGLGLWLLTVVLAYPASLLYHEPRLMWLLPVVGFGSVIAGVSSPNLLTLARHLGVGRLSMLELASQVTLFGFSLAYAYFQRSIWALAIGRVVSELVRAALSYRLLEGGVKPRFVLERASVRTLLGFGKWILLSTSLTFLATQSDRLILPKLLPAQTAMTMLGVYSIAFSLSDLPRQIIGMFAQKVGFPFIAKFSHLPRPEFRLVLLKYRMMVLAVGAVLLTFTICIGDLFIMHVYKQQYHAAAWMIAIFALGLWHTLLYNTISYAILSLQKAHYNAIANFCYCITLFAILPLGYHFFGMVGAVAAVAVSDFPVYVVNVYAAYKTGLGVLKQDGMMTVVFLLTLALGLGIRHAFGLGLPFPGMPHY